MRSHRELPVVRARAVHGGRAGDRLNFWAGPVNHARRERDSGVRVVEVTRFGESDVLVPRELPDLVPDAVSLVDAAALLHDCVTALGIANVVRSSPASGCWSR